MERETHVDLEAVEAALKAGVLAAGAGVLEQLLEPIGVGRRDAPVRCACGRRMLSRGVKTKALLTVLGYTRFERTLFACPRCKQTRFPGDEALGIVGTSRSPGVVRLVARFAFKEPFKEAAADIRETAGIPISAKDVERIAEGLGREMEVWMKRERQRLHQDPEPEGPPIEHLYIEFDGTGVPMVPEAVAGRKGKQSDGSAKTREAKLGSVFTQTAFNADGKPIRDPASTSFVGAIEDAAAFGPRIYDEAVRRGLFRARKVTVLTDAAEWNKNLADTYFPMAQHIIDFFHGSQHITALAKALFETNPAFAQRHAEQWADDLYDGRVQTIIKTVQDLLPKDHNRLKDARKELNYFVKNADRMRYDRYRAQGMFIGSGVIEAACKHIVGSRLKQSGMEWTVQGANAILALRCAMLSNRFEDFWEYRATPGNIITYPITSASAVA